MSSEEQNDSRILEFTPQEEKLVESWLRLLRQAYKYAKAGHRNRILMVQVDRFDNRGIDVYSELWGAINYVAGLLPPDIYQLGIVTPAGLRSEARHDALAELDAELQDQRFLDLVKEARNERRN